jgi:hypothetical protein
MVEQHDRRQVEAIGLAVDPTPGRDPVFDAAPRFLNANRHRPASASPEWEVTPRNGARR